MIGLLIALSAGAPTPQAVQATLQSCAIEQERWVCRYQVPDVEIIPFTGTPGAAGALGEVEVISRSGPGPGSDSDAPRTDPPLARDRASAESGLLTEDESRLVTRCADAGWLSLCLPDDRRAARLLRDRQAAYQQVRRAVTGLLAESRCDTAVRTALDAGYLGLAREARDFCAGSAEADVVVQAGAPGP